jgi:hypothetical protein
MSPDDIKIFPIFRNVPQAIYELGRVRCSLVLGRCVGTEYDEADRIADAYLNGDLRDNKLLLGAWGNGQIVGWSAATLDADDAGIMSIQTMSVHKKYQYVTRCTQGLPPMYIGSQLLAATEQIMSLYGAGLHFCSSQMGKELYLRRGYEMMPGGISVRKDLSCAPDGAYPLFQLSEQMFADMTCVLQDCWPMAGENIVFDTISTVKFNVDTNKWPTFGYFVDGRLVGFAQGNLRSCDAVPALRLNALFVAGAMQRKFGIGTALVRSFLNYASGANIGRVMLRPCLDSDDPDELSGLIDFYKKAGGFEMCANGGGEMVRVVSRRVGR